ncbi:MAG: alpha-1,4-glucan--maltose-1-phosphate maltosyltransferase [Ignavibacteria bacterium]|jgi:starch synthase (maltosyl-transferring)|nr:alpha-1,4-glucan--maltose-1-phosphate maltosyltransferase [Ignavibacteria bacterium]MCU7502409.1 alpha-1,4-glucan--maltose-1-phosphate maltosyltransferase [Ignavibacteria bacterium]MCU7515026.1 alpha-1,4-glucan--maltose-1-phosphate maltosyltransferase [Ignavibacteria bacterium]
MDQEGRQRVVIENVKPNINCGAYPVKRVTGEKVVVTADVFADGHDTIAAEILYRNSKDNTWKTSPMKFVDNDLWDGSFRVEEEGSCLFTIRGWVDHFTTWQKDLVKRIDAGQDVSVELMIGADMIDKNAKNANGDDQKKLLNFSDKIRSGNAGVAFDDELSLLMGLYADKSAATVFQQEYEVWVERHRALFSSWYELFPRSASPNPGRHGTFKDVERLLPDISEMGFDVIYLPPIHPIGITNRKGKNNSTEAGPEDPGSPWAIGSKEGGHKSIHPELGSMDDFKELIRKAGDFGIEIALDIACQCSPDHPYVKEHPEWFKWRPDGTVQYAENPPKKYQDVLPINFETENWKKLWDELRSVILFWIDNGVKIFRVDNPHTKPFGFWEWLIKDIKKEYPEVIFLAEAFTRPKVMYRLAKAGFTQSYTYFTWRNTKDEFKEYLTELTKRDAREFYRPNFWTNTPDILPENLQYGGRAAFISRFVLAATLSSNYGIYGPSYEICNNTGIEDKEEYLNSEKYEIKHWDRNKSGNIKDIIKKVNIIRKENSALQTTFNIEFYDSDNRYLLCYGKVSEDKSNIIVVVVNLNFFHKQSGSVKIPIKKLGIPEKQSYLVHELLSDKRLMWQGSENFVELDPETSPASIFKIYKRLKREDDFDYFM